MRMERLLGYKINRHPQNPFQMILEFHECKEPDRAREGYKNINVTRFLLFTFRKRSKQRKRLDSTLFKFLLVSSKALKNGFPFHVDPNAPYLLFYFNIIRLEKDRILLS